MGCATTCRWLPIPATTTTPAGANVPASGWACGSLGSACPAKVDPDDYLSVMYGRRPDDAGRVLERAGSRKTLGWDLTFSARTSVPRAR
jgi:hypothetical protein